MMASLLRNRWMLVALVLVLLLFLPWGSLAQQTPPTPPDDANSPQVGPSFSPDQSKEDEQLHPPAPATDDVNPQPPRPAGASVLPLFRLGGGGLVEANQNPFRIGPIYLGSAEILGGFNSFSPSDSNQNIKQTGTLVRSDIVLDQLYKNVRFTTQWEPRLSNLDGNSRGDIDNGLSRLQAKFDLTNRLDLLLLEQISYLGSNAFYGDYFFTAGVFETPVVQQNSFLDTPGHALNNTALAELNYRLSATTRLYFSPSFNYFHTTTNTSLLDSSHEYRGRFGVDHKVSSRTSVGLSYDLSAVTFKLYGGTVFYNTLSGTYAHLFSPTVSFTGSAGVSSYQLSNGHRSWTSAFWAALTKNVGTGTLSLAYTRSLYLADYTTTQFTDRVDGQYGQSLGPRLSFGLGAGLQRESRMNGFRGHYAQMNVSFRLSSLLSAYARYSNLYQTGDQGFLITGTRNLIVFGLRFQAPTPTRRPTPTQP